MTTRGRTLWEMLLDRFQGPLELRSYNPLKARIGSSLMFNILDMKEYNFFVKEIREYQRTLGGRQFSFVDYVLMAKPLGADEVWVRLRLVPIEGAQAPDLTHHALVLRLYDEFAHDEAFYKVVTDTTRKFEVREDGRVTEEYGRINDVTDPYEAQVTLIKDLNNDGTIERDEVQTTRVQYWDYWREVKDEAGQPVHQYLFVEMDAETGWFQIWRGAEIDAQKVVVF